MNKGKRVFILLLAVVLLVGVYFALTHFLKDEDENDNVSVNEISVVSIKSEDIVGIHYIYGEEDITLIKDSDLWYLESDKKFPLNQTFATLMASEAADLCASRLISETSEDFAEYGLSEPSNAIEYTLSNGSKMTYFFGDYNGFSNSYYFNIFGEEKIYIVSASFFEVYEKGSSDLADVEDITAVSTEEIKSVSMILDGKSTKIFRNIEGLKTVYTDNYTWFSNSTTPLNSATASELAGLSVSYNVSGCADYQLEENEFSLYGFDNPVLTLNVKYSTAENEEKILKFFVGGQHNDGRFYAKTDDSDVVYLIDTDYIESLRSFDIKSLRYADVCLIDVEEIESMTVSVSEKTSSIKLDPSKDEFNSIYSLIESMNSEGITDQKVIEEKPFITIVFKLKREGFSEMTMKFIPLDRSFYVVDFNGRCDILVNKRDVESLSLMIESLKG